MAIFPQGLTTIDKRCDNAGERHTLHQLKRCLSDDYMVWHDIPIGPKARQPDFVILSPRRGLLILEVKHWAKSTLLDGNRDSVNIQTLSGIKAVDHPLQQARKYAMELNNLLASDPALIQEQDPFKGHSRVPYGWGCVFSNMRSHQIAGSNFNELFPESKTLLRDDLDEGLDAYEFEKRLWGMFAGWAPHALSLPQRDRVRWHLFPELRMQPVQGSLVDESGAPAFPLPDLMQVMDLQQEQTARTLGEGHRVIHGAAGSGKTMILIFRAQQLAASARADQPILVLCYSKHLAKRIDSMLRQRGVDERVVVRTFHAWCEDMLKAYQLERPSAGSGSTAYFEELAQTVQRSMKRGLVPSGQYTALLIDEAHDFEDAWLQMAASLVTPVTQSLLVLYDDAQSIFQKKRRKFNFAAVGIDARGRTSVLKLNYRNTAEVLALALHCAQGLLTQKRHQDNDLQTDMQTVQPMSAGRRGALPTLMEAANGNQEATLIAERIANAAANGMPLGNMAVLCRKNQMDTIAKAIKQQAVACQSMNDVGFRAFDWQACSVKLITLQSAKGLEFELVFIAGLDTMPSFKETLDDAVQLLYVGMTRATGQLVLSCAGPSAIVQRVKNSLEAVHSQFAPIESI